MGPSEGDPQWAHAHGMEQTLRMGLWHLGGNGDSWWPIVVDAVGPSSLRNTSPASPAHGRPYTLSRFELGTGPGNEQVIGHGIGLE